MTSKLAQMQARFQQKQMQEREEKLVKLYENQQQRAFERVGRGSAGSNTSIGSTGGCGGGKVRQMFDERRQKAGIDRSYPLEPLKSKNNSRGNSVDRTTSSTRTLVKSTVQGSINALRNGKPAVSKREVVHSVYNNNNGDESYEEHVHKDDGRSPFSSKSHRAMIEMMNNHNLRDELDSEEMPEIGFDEIDNSYVNDKLVRKAEPPKSVMKPNGVALPLKKEANTSFKKSTKTTPPVVTRTTISPRTATTSSSLRPTKPTNSTNLGTNSNSTSTMQAQKSNPRAPSSNRPSAKQSARSAVVRDDLAECQHCGRRFAADRIQKHEDVCSKTGKKKRKAYDATKHRVTGTELESYVLRSGGKGKSTTSTRSSSNRQASKKDWRKTHEEFISAIRSAKQAQAHLAKGGKLSDLPPPPPSTNSDYVQCPHCGRRFNEAAAERHIPKCASYQFNKPKPGPPPARGNPRR